VQQHQDDEQTHCVRHRITQDGEAQLPDSD
jgi:hypothetical protein